MTSTEVNTSRYNLRKRKSATEEKSEKKQKSSSTVSSKTVADKKDELKDAKKSWVRMMKNLKTLEKELIEFKKVDKMKSIGKEISEIIKSNTQERSSKIKDKLISKIKSACPKKLLKVIEAEISDIEYARFVSHGKHGAQFTCYILWYTFGEHRVVYLDMCDHFGSHDGQTFIDSSLCPFKFPVDDIESYTRDWGKSNISKEDQEKFFEFISGHSSSDDDDDADINKLPKFLVPLALLCIEDEYTENSYREFIETLC